MSSDTNQIQALQALRGLAALSVFLFHLVPYCEVAGTTLFPEFLLQWGYAGVDVFFVLSGFVLALSGYKQGSGYLSAQHFYRRRLSRIYSGYWPFFFVMLLVNFVFDFQRRIDDNFLGSFFLFETDVQHLTLGVSWSLTFELYFYFLFGLGFFLSAQTVLKLCGAYTALIILVQYVTPIEAIRSHFLLSPYLLEFFLGCGLGLLYRERALLQLRVIAWLAFPLFFFLGSSLDNQPPSQIPTTSIVTFGLGGGALMIALIGLEKIWESTLGRLLIKLGDASYTLYLCHIIFIDVFHQLGFFYWLSALPAGLSDIGVTVFIAGVCIFSAIFFRLIELPLFRKLAGSSTQTST